MEAQFGARIYTDAWTRTAVFLHHISSIMDSCFLLVCFQLAADSWLKDVVDYRTRIQLESSGLWLVIFLFRPGSKYKC